MKSISAYLEEYIFPEDRSQTVTQHRNLSGLSIPYYINQFWTARQRQASSIHEVSYRACFKAQLPRFFIDLLTLPGDRVYDPFSGRGTTIIEAALMGREVIANDVNPLSTILAKPRLEIPPLDAVLERIEEIPIQAKLKADLDLSMFYHPDTEAEIVSLKKYLQKRSAEKAEDDLDRWLRMVATNRLTGHSSGFFSVYTLPPNQAVSPESQIKINQKRNQNPPYRSVSKLIGRKTASLLRNLSGLQVENLNRAARSALFLQCDAADTPQIEDCSVKLTVTSPPFLDVVQYAQDNWLRCWFNDLDSAVIEKKLTLPRTVEQWSKAMSKVFAELYRITAPGGWVAFEVGEVRKGKIRLEESVIPLGKAAGFHCEGVLINSQPFTKTANIWGIDNNKSGTNTNRIVIFNKT